MIDYHIINSGSDGNSTVFNGRVMIDCGVPFKLIEPVYKDLKLVLLTHIHSDHFNKATIRRLAKERPTLRFACGRWLVSALRSAGVDSHNIDVLECDVMYGYGICNVTPVFLQHNVPNCGYKIHFGDAGKVFYATDCSNLNGITAVGYDLYMVEANYEDAEIAETIEQKRADGLFAYEVRAKKNHLSKAKCNDWLYKNMAANSVYVYMHCHKD